MDIESQKILIKKSYKTKLYEFFIIDHPLLILIVWLLLILILSIMISSNFTKNNNETICHCP